MKRRNAMELIVIGAGPVAGLAQQHDHGAQGATTAPATTAKRFFDARQMALVEELAEMIVPKDEHSGGAKEANVAAFIDEVIGQGDAAAQQAWKAGLAAVDAEARRQFGKGFVEASFAEKDRIVVAMAEGEEAPKTDMHRFFVRVKAQTLSGYYTSPVGLLKDLEYKGIVPIAAYPACEHPDHVKGVK
jgi:gluconate 2-dehydrogenase gamma chain